MHAFDAKEHQQLVKAQTANRSESVEREVKISAPRARPAPRSLTARSFRWWWRRDWWASHSLLISERMALWEEPLADQEVRIGEPFATEQQGPR